MVISPGIQLLQLKHIFSKNTQCALVCCLSVCPVRILNKSPERMDEEWQRHTDLTAIQRGTHTNKSAHTLSLYPLPSRWQLFPITSVHLLPLNNQQAGVCYSLTHTARVTHIYQRIELQMCYSVLKYTQRYDVLCSK